MSGPHSSKGLFEGSGLVSRLGSSWVQGQGSLRKVRGHVMSVSPHKDRSTAVCVCCGGVFDPSQFWTEGLKTSGFQKMENICLFLSS